LEDSVEIGAKAKALPDDGEEQIDRGGDPDLCFDCIGGSSEEGLDPQMLFDPLEEQFDLPAALVKLSNG
jgi:hypothetical protein